ncbi:hypothetical protein E9993_20940 [Labilibacter sediminis]|nr:hypothetical protein E9993_20940 [Labilibacter sediminis]
MLLERYILFTCFLLLSFSLTFGQQGNLLEELSTSKKNVTSQDLSHFKSSRVILGPSTIQIDSKDLQFRISHLFGSVTDGIEELYGLDQIYNVDIALDYGFKDWLSIGLARSSDLNKTVQSNVKLTVFQQTYSGSDISLSYQGGFNIKTRKYANEIEFVDRLEYVHQLLMSHRFNN